MGRTILDTQQNSYDFKRVYTNLEFVHKDNELLLTLTKRLEHRGFIVNYLMAVSLTYDKINKPVKLCNICLNT